MRFFNHVINENTEDPPLPSQYLVGERLAIKKTGPWLRNQELLLLAVLLGARDKVFKLRMCVCCGVGAGGASGQQGRRGFKLSTRQDLGGPRLVLEGGIR